jgi:hypothetical protein
MEGDDLVEAVPMPEGLIAWVQAFVERHHVDQPFEKRKRNRPETKDAPPENQAEGARARQRGPHG